jgi:aspartyl/asparaginyl-tRNA synthetase
MKRRDQILFKGFILEEIRSFFKSKGVPEVRYNQFSFAGSCENAPTTYWLDKDDAFLMLPQTRQIMAEEDLIKNGVEAVYMMQTSYRDEPRAGDGRHCNQFLLCEMEHLNLSQKKLIDFEEEMIRYMIGKSIDYFEKNKLSNKKNIARLKYTLEIDYPRVEYTQIIDTLNENGISINWGDDFRSTEEQFICGIFEEIPVPVAVFDYPETLKYFNMYEKRDKNQGTSKSVVECCDFLLPFAGETFGSSRREVDGERIRKRFYNGSMYKQLKDRLMNKKDINSEKQAEKVISDAFSTYFNMFDNGIYERAGFGMGVGRLAQFLLGSTKIIEI